ncbi:phosphatidylethanolamine-binding protein [Immersiella caudata]|uniref:Phosphatidylethanolamine-binding protein n=1 Tax=Immersiella caudata TaxID=314043 RepID=A0AA39WPJ9_9PEZI|nr:phosphatidylethanolamine-binding protein [Immersiella caudata]
MLLQSLVSGVTLAGLVAAQTPAGFTPEVKDRLDLIVGTKVITVPGTALTRAETARQPVIGTSDTILSGTYLWMMIDLDVPANFQNPSAGARRTNLHAMISGFKSSGQTSNGVNTLTSTATGPIAYVGPGPPPENPPYAHRYVSLLYETNSTFSVSRTQVGQTFGFNLATFATAVGLGQPIRANYWNVTGQ